MVPTLHSQHPGGLVMAGFCGSAGSVWPLSVSHTNQIAQIIVLKKESQETQEIRDLSGAAKLCVSVVYALFPIHAQEELWQYSKYFYESCDYGEAFCRSLEDGQSSCNTDTKKLYGEIQDTVCLASIPKSFLKESEEYQMTVMSCLLTSLQIQKIQT